MKILVVDDSRYIRRIIRNELEDSGYTIIEAKNSSEALEKLETERDIDLITLDIEMPRKKWI